MSTVSVIIPCFNVSEWIGETLRSVVNQDAVHLEIIVVDDGSTDGSRDLVAREFPDVKLLSQKHHGPSAARNHGTQHCSGEFIQYLDADDVLAPRKLSRQVDLLTETAADVAYGDWLELRRTFEGAYHPGRTVARRIQGEPDIALFTDFWCPPAAYLFRRRIVERVGGWREDLPIIQDARFVLDCALHGARFAYCPGIAAYYRMHSNGSVSTRDPREFTRDCLRNALSVERWWAEHGGISQAREAALIKVYGQVARSSFETDLASFDAACRALERIRPGYTPARPVLLHVTARAAGYRRAEAVAAHYRRAKRKLTGNWRRLVRLQEPRAQSSSAAYARLRTIARWAYRVPGVKALARYGLRMVVLRSHLSRRTKQRLHNFFAVDVAPTGVVSCRAVDVAPGRPINLQFRVRDDLTRYWYFWGYAHYELGTIRLLRRLLRTRHAFVDVGANVGYHTFLAASLLEGRGIVHAFEPRASVYAELAASARRSAFSCLELNQVALSDSDGMARLFLPGATEWTTASLLPQGPDERYETVQTARFDSYCKRRCIERVDLVKIDVEGAELQVLSGMGDLLAKWRPDLIIEVLEPFEDELDWFFSETPYRKFRIRDEGLDELTRITAEPHDRNVYLSCEPDLWSG